MNEKEILTKKFILVDMGDAKISTEEKPIIGTQALATCIGVILYSEEIKKAIVAHIPPEPEIAIEKMLNLIIDNKLLKVPFKYRIIYGTDKTSPEFRGTVDLLKKYFHSFTPFDEKEFSSNDIRTNEEFMSREFAFDATAGKFVTDKVFFGKDYISINNENIENFNTIKHRK